MIQRRDIIETIRYDTNRYDTIRLTALTVYPFKMLSQITAAQSRLPQTACFLAPQTQENLQQICLTVMTICYTKATSGDYWRSANRVSEISIEEFFGRLRTQAQSA